MRTNSKYSAALGTIALGLALVGALFSSGGTMVVLRDGNAPQKPTADVAHLHEKFGHPILDEVKFGDPILDEVKFGDPILDEVKFGDPILGVIEI